ncbi:hypothetical protein PybrP1_002478 [[Pythium] brassicae (nom. inval.)]|nr:hypothetical protein PybrP1_002478 [[Pythium] brassicae (nom. inval.)]
MSATDSASAAVALGVEGVSVDHLQQQSAPAMPAALGRVIGRKRAPPSAYQQLQSLIAQSSGSEARLLEPDSDLDGAESDEDDEDDDDDDEAATGDSESPTTGGAQVHAAMGSASPGGGGGVANSSTGGRRMRLTLGQKREVVDLAASKKFTHRELAEQFHVGRTTITNICRQEELIRTETDSADAIKKKRKTTKFAYDMRVLDECLHKWRMEVKVSQPDTKITGSVLQQKAMDLALKILHEPSANLPEKVRQALGKFTASNGWLDGYRMRFGSFSSKVVVGDQSVIKNVDTQTRLRELHHSLAGVELQDIWATSEFAVVHKPSAAAATAAAAAAHHLHDPSASLALTGSGGIAEAASSGRYTLSLMVSAAGETFDMQVIGTERAPPLVPDSVDLQRTYRIQYGHSKTGCQVAHTTVAYLKSLNALAKARKRTFRVILDSAVPHVKAAMILDSQGDQRTFFVYDQLQLFFLPPNFKPPRFHPCHLGVVQAFKARFRYEMVETLFAAYRHALLHSLPPDASAGGGGGGISGGFHPARFLHTRNVFHWFHVALQSLHAGLIQNCWVNSGLLPTQALVALNMKEIKAANTSHPLAAATAPGLPNPSVIYRDLQLLMTDVLHLAPDFLQWIGVVDPLNAQAFAELEANASVTDPGVDEAQIIRSVLQKNDFLLSKRADDALRGPGPADSGLSDSVAGEQCPRPDEVLASIEVLKRYLRLSKDPVLNRADAVVHLNAVKSTLSSAAVHDV